MAIKQPVPENMPDMEMLSPDMLAMMNEMAFPIPETERLHSTGGSQFYFSKYMDSAGVLIKQPDDFQPVPGTAPMPDEHIYAGSPSPSHAYAFPKVCPSQLAPPTASQTGSSAHTGRYYFQTREAQSGQHRVAQSYDVQRVREDFSILKRQVHGKQLIWLDNAATSQKPNRVIDAISDFYRRHNSNVHRGAHTLAAEATDALEEARGKVASFLGTSNKNEIVFVRGTTEAINLVANTFGTERIKAGDEIVVTRAEHHANIVPWQMLAQRNGAILKVAPLDDMGMVILEEYERLVTSRTKLVSIAHVTNTFGTVNPVNVMTRYAQSRGARVLIDGAQAVPHFAVNVAEIGCDFYAFSGHKMYGPTGIGALYGKEDLLNSIPPWQGGGSMIENVSFEKTSYRQTPQKFEAGTGSLAPAVGLGVAVDYLNSIGMHAIHSYGQQLINYITTQLAMIPRVQMYGTAPGRVSVTSFVVDGIDVTAMGRFLDQEGIAVRAGHHCAQPALAHFGLKETVRASLGLYNTYDEIDAFVEAVRKGIRVLS